VIQWRFGCKNGDSGFERCDFVWVFKKLMGIRASPLTPFIISRGR
jgi:hypothetical protein